MFFPPRYAIRVLKSFVYIAALFFLLLSFMYAFSEKSKPDMTFIDLIPEWRRMLVFFAMFSVTYPLISFARKEVWLSKPFAEERINIIGIFSNVGYELESDKDGVLKFRLKNRFYGFMRLFFEDAVEVDYKSGSPITVSGMRRDTYRIARHIEYLNGKPE